MPPELPRRIEAARIYLRSYQVGDGRLFYAIRQRNRVHLARYEADNVVMSVASEQEAEVVVGELAAEWEARTSFFMGAFDRATGDFVAQVYLGPVSPELAEFEIGYFVDRDHEGRGYITEAVQAALAFAFEHLDAQRVRVECDDTNERSWRVAERCGMVREGHIREHKMSPDGKLTGTLYYGLQRTDFEALP